jgi:hypothetical protein
VIVKIPVTTYNEDKALVKERDKCTFLINQSVDCTSFLTDTSSNTKGEDLKKELQTIYGQFFHIDPLKWFQE